MKKFSMSGTIIILVLSFAAAALAGTISMPVSPDGGTSTAPAAAMHQNVLQNNGLMQPAGNFPGLSTNDPAPGTPLPTSSVPPQIPEPAPIILLGLGVAAMVFKFARK